MPATQKSHHHACVSFSFPGLVKSFFMMEDANKSAEDLALEAQLHSIQVLEKLVRDVAVKAQQLARQSMSVSMAWQDFGVKVIEFCQVQVEQEEVATATAAAAVAQVHSSGAHSHEDGDRDRGGDGDEGEGEAKIAAAAAGAAGAAGIETPAEAAAEAATEAVDMPPETTAETAAMTTDMPADDMEGVEGADEPGTHTYCDL